MTDVLPPVPAGFEVVGELGRGRAAVVWSARHLLTGEEVALKVWWRPLADAYARERFAAECTWLRLLSGHPRVVDWVWASAPEDGAPWLATRLHGTSLAQRLREDGPPELEVALQLALDLLDGLAELHARGLVHRDVNPGNLLVEDGRGVLCDLGLVLPVDAVTRETQAGTPGFVAPELDPGGDAQLDRRSDVWSAAATIAQMVGDAAPEPVDHLVHAVAGSARREDRPADAQDFARRLRAAAERSGVTVRADGPPPVARRRVPAAALVLASAVVGAGLALGASAWRDDGASPSATAARPGTGAATAVLAALPDVGAGDRPQLRDPRDPGRCEGLPRAGGDTELRDGDRVVAGVRLWFDAAGRACAKVAKTPTSGLLGVPTYLALSLCNADGRCDHDWNRYRTDAGPVSVSAPDGCVTWRVSAMDAAEATWLVRDASGSSGCAS